MGIYDIEDKKPKMSKKERDELMNQEVGHMLAGLRLQADQKLFLLLELQGFSLRLFRH